MKVEAVLVALMYTKPVRPHTTLWHRYATVPYAHLSDKQPGGGIRVIARNVQTNFHQNLHTI